MIEVRRISAVTADKLDDLSVLKTLQRSLLGKLYVRFLKPFPIFRALAIGVWPGILPVVFFLYGKYKFLRSKNFLQKNSFPLKKLSEYALDRHVIFPKQVFNISTPNFFPRKKNDISKFQNVCEFPEIYIACIENCTVTGASNFLSVNEGVICHDLFRCSHDYTSEELHGRFVINCKKSQITHKSYTIPTVVVDKGVVFTDAVSGNYVHFLTEVLPRMFAFSRVHPRSDAHLIIDFGLHPNLMEAIELVVGKNVDLIGLVAGETLLVKSLQVVSPCGYVPFQRRPKIISLKNHSDGIFSPHALSEMVDLIKGNISNIVEVKKNKKIFIKRNSAYRNISNAEEVERALVDQGFVVVEPEKLNFLEQVAVFSNAEVVVGATGAAFANLIFCKPETKIIILISDYKNMIYGYWQSMACAVGNKVAYVIGKSNDLFPQLHSDFQIDISDLLDAISD